MAMFVFPQAVKQIHSIWGKTKKINGKESTLDSVRVVQRFVTVAYLGGKPIATIHWTSTVEGPPDEKPGAPKAKVIDVFQGGKDPAEVIREWKAGGVEKIED